MIFEPFSALCLSPVGVEGPQAPMSAPLFLYLMQAPRHTLNTRWESVERRSSGAPVLPSELSNVGVKKHACEAKLGLIEYPTTHASKAD